MSTSFDAIENVFLSKITDDMYMELTIEETQAMMDELLINALYYFEFPRVDIFNFDKVNRTFVDDLTSEEINIISTYMVVEWLGQQLATVDLVKQKYSGSDFKFTSQASHLKQLMVLKEQYITSGFHLQRVYCRRTRKDNKPGYSSTFDKIMSNE